MFVDHSTITCSKEGCGISFMVPSHWSQKRREDHKTFYCPNGHSQWFPQESEEEKLRRERDRLKQNTAYLEDRLKDKDRQVSAARGQVTRIKNRISAGVCPCCNRSFSNLAKHMAHMHKEYKKEKVA